MEKSNVKITHIIWDWNGTLLDDVGAALNSVNTMLERRGKSPIDMDQYYEYIDIPIKKFYEHIFDLENEEYSGILKEYNDGYENQMYEIGLSNGAREALNIIRSNGLRQSVISSCEQNQLNYYVKYFDLENYFDAVLGAEDFFASSKIERAKRYIESNQINPLSVLVVGDLVHDYEMAKTIGANCVLVSTGHQSESALLDCGANVVSSVSQIIEYIM